VKDFTNSNERLNRREMFRTTAAGAAGALALHSLSSASLAQNAPPAPRQSPSGPETSFSWISTTETVPWQTKTADAGGRGGFGGGFGGGARDLDVRVESPAQTIEGFGACFNELGWTSLQELSEEDRDGILRELFAPGVGANFTICRMPLGANDFSRDWYSYDETPDDFALDHFSIANDLETLVPFIKSAQRHNPSLRLWASPWSPPTWMKRNKHYNGRLEGEDESGRGAGAGPGRTPRVTSGPDFDLFIREERYFRTYAAYFGRFIDSYREQGLDIGMVMPQNEFNSAQRFPSCTWNPETLAEFIRYLGPEMSRREVEIYFGTLERANVQMLETALDDPEAGQYIRGVGAQWAGKGAVPGIHERHPELPIYQTEQECGNGQNEWAYCVYAWDLMKHYLRNGTNAYLYWNMSLLADAESHWGWRQNSLVSVDPESKTFRYNHEYYLMKHLSHFVKSGAKRVETQGTFDNALAFVNPDESVAVVLRNDSGTARTVNVTAGTRSMRVALDPDSFNSVLLEREG